MSVSSGRNPKGYYQRSLNSKDHTFRKYGRSLLNPKSIFNNIDLVSSSIKTEKHWNQISLHSKKEPRITLPVKPTGYKSSILIQRKKSRNTAVKSDVKEKHNQVSKCEKLSSQTEVSLLISTDKSKSPDLRHIPIWLRKSLKFVQNCFLEAPPKLTDSSPHNANKEDGNAPPNTFQVVHKSLKSAKANISDNLEEIFSKLGLEQWIKEYENAHDESVNENSSKDQHIISSCSRQITSNLTHSNQNECLLKKRLRKESYEEDHLQGQLVSPNTIENQSKSCPSDSEKQSKDKKTRFSLQDKLNTPLLLTSNDKIHHTSLDLLSLEVFDRLQGNWSTNSKSPSLVSNKGFSQIGIHGRPTVLKNNHHEYPIGSCYPRSPSNCSKCLNELPTVEKQNHDAVLKQNIIRCDDINFGLIGRNEVGPESQKIHHWLDENTYLSGLCQPALADTCNKKRKHTISHKSDVKDVDQQENTKHMDSALNIVSPPMHPIWDTPEDLRTSSLTDFLRL
ncbi:unnamed protein product [Schistosoma intercalatum]|nr:unnamed protein product [Schistosoma intercalatum]CAH8644604.1 unnamed protein product [Schistosoma intercalatum]